MMLSRGTRLDRVLGVGLLVIYLCFLCLRISKSMRDLFFCIQIGSLKGKDVSTSKKTTHVVLESLDSDSEAQLLSTVSFIRFRRDYKHRQLESLIALQNSNLEIILLGWLAVSPFILGALYIILIPCFNDLVRKFSVVDPLGPKTPPSDIKIKSYSQVIHRVCVGGGSERGNAQEDDDNQIG